MVNKSSISKAIKDAQTDKNQTKLTFFRGSAISLIARVAEKISPNKLSTTDPAQPTPTPTRKQPMQSRESALQPPAAAAATTAVQIEPAEPAKPAEKLAAKPVPSAPPAPLKSAKKTKAQKKRDRVKHLIARTMEAEPCASNICNSAPGDHIPRGDQWPVTATPFGTFVRQTCGLPAVQATCGVEEQKKLWVCISCYNHAYYKWSLVKMLMPSAHPGQHAFVFRICFGLFAFICIQSV